MRQSRLFVCCGPGIAGQILCLASLATLAGALPAAAASDEACRNYAQAAVAQDRENRRLGCGFDGAWWHSQESGHFITCKVADEVFLDVEAATRAEQLAVCAQAAGAANPDGAQPAAD